MVTGIIILVHLLVTAIVAVLTVINLIKIPKPFLMVVVCVPVFGLLCALIIHFYAVSGRAGSKNSELESMRSSLVWEDEEPTIIEESENDIPLEDALILDDPVTRRSVMLDVLMENNYKYASALSKARMNDDVEVVHYATTAMAEFSKEYELRLQQYAVRYSEDQSNEKLLNEYIDYIGSYIGSGLCMGQLLEIQTNTYQQLLRDLLRIHPSLKRYIELASSYLDSRQFGLADELSEYLYDKYPSDEDVCTLRIRYFYETRQGDKLRKLVDACKKRDEYKSVDFRKFISFWDGKEEMQA